MAVPGILNLIEQVENRYEQMLLYAVFDPESMYIAIVLINYITCKFNSSVMYWFYPTVSIVYVLYCYSVVLLFSCS